MKLLFSDIDGTLLNKEKMISTELKNAIIDFINHGNKFILCSGRPEKSILYVKTKLCLPDKNVYISSCNGAKLYDCEQKKTISEIGIPIQMVRKILDAAYTLHLHCHTYDAQSVLSEFQTKELTQYTHHVTMQSLIVDDIPTYLDSNPLKMLSICMDEVTPFPTFQKMIDEISNHTLTSLLSKSSYLEIFSSLAGKGSSIKALANYLSVSMEDTIAVGDAPNDISMIQTAHVGVAMQNADELTKTSADYITKNNNEDNGLIEILNKFTT